MTKSDCTLGGQGTAPQDMHEGIDPLVLCRAPGRKQTLAFQELPIPDRVGTEIEFSLKFVLKHTPSSGTSTTLQFSHITSKAHAPRD